MGEMVTFQSNGSEANGYFAAAEGGGPGVVVIQEWWGLVPHITDVCDRFASAGITALAPDLFRGESTTEPDEAGKLMMALNLDRAVRDMSGAIDFLRSHPAVTSERVGVTGFCMGGGLALVLACARPEAIGACAPFYGLIPWEGAQPDWSTLDCPVRGHYAENDGFFGPDAVAELRSTLDGLGKDAVLTVHPGVDHAFFNDTRAEVFDAARVRGCVGHDGGLLPFDPGVSAGRGGEAESADDLARRYIVAGLRLGRHNPDIVDAYYGPAELSDRVAAEPVEAPERLAGDLQNLVADLDAASAPDLAAPRRAWLRSQCLGLRTVAQKLAGVDIDYSDEVERCFGVRPVPLSADEIEEARRDLDVAIGGDGPLGDRLGALRERHVIPAVRLGEVIGNISDHLRERTEALFGLPAGESVRFELVENKPYSGFNFYEGNFRSLVTINTDLPVLSTSIAHLVAHEAYPGHHTEHSHKEAGLVRRRHQMEESIALIGTPACLMAEGLADLGLEMLVGETPAVAVEEMVADAGAHYEVEAVAALARFGEVTARARGTLALELHSAGRDPDEVVALAERWLVVDHARASKTVEFLTDPTWRAYVFCYAEGHRLCRSFVGGDPERFRRLLDEQLTPADLAA